MVGNIVDHGHQLQVALGSVDNRAGPDFLTTWQPIQGEL